MSKRTSTDFSRLITTKSITIGFDGETRTIRKEDPAYQKLLDAIREERWDDIPDLLKPERAVATMSDGDMRVENGQVIVKGPEGEFAVPSGLNATILHYIENQLPFKPLVKFAINLSQNPSYRSVQQLFSFLEHNNFTITEEGKFIAYKGVTKEFLDCHTRSIDNSIGAVVKMLRNQVNEDPNQTCSYGLHVASYDYAHNHYGSGSAGVTLYVEVNPRDVVAVPVDYNNAKMRVCEYKVLGISQGEFKEPIYRDPASEVDCDVEDDYDDQCEGCDYPVGCCDCQEYPTY
jgi:hypothetical protein